MNSMECALLLWTLRLSAVLSVGQCRKPTKTADTIVMPLEGRFACDQETMGVTLAPTGEYNGIVYAAAAAMRPVATNIAAAATCVLFRKTCLCGMFLCLSDC